MPDCLFCKIRDGQISSKKVHQDEHVFAFEDIYPQAPTHILIVPHEHIPTVNAIGPQHREVVGHLFLTAAHIAKARGIETTGYRLVMNTNQDAGQTVFHIHLHLMGGRPLQWPPG